LLVMTLRTRCVVASPGPSFCLAAGRGAYAIRALRDLCFGIISERLGHLYE